MAATPGREVESAAPKRRRHLIDPDAPRPAYDPEAAKRLAHVQQWVLSALAVTTIFHLVVGLIVAAVLLDEVDRVGQVGLVMIAGLFAVMAVALARAIHTKRVLSTWLLVGLLPVAVGLWLVLR